MFLHVNLSDSWTAGQRIVRVSAAEAVFSSLRKAIEDGRLAVGARLSSEAVLAQQYGVSRSVIREALRSCASLGLTETRTGKGTFVVADRVGGDLALGQYSARELTEARPHIEVPAAGLAAQRRSDDELQLLRDIVAAMVREADPQAWVALDATFHAAIARMSGNRVFEKVVADIRDAMANQSETLNMVAGRKGDSDTEHGEILAAIEAGSPEQASAAMSRHLAAVDAALDRVLHS
jgi:DNA-binding FadR family transcriptional regulator